MKRVHHLLLFVFCIALVFFIDAQDFSSVADLLTLHLVDYLFLFLWAGVFFMLLLPFVHFGRKFLFAPEKNK